MKLTSLAPMLHSEDLAGTIAFYRDVLGFELEGTWEEDDTMIWCCVAHGPVRIMFSRIPGATTPAMSGQLYLYTDDILAIHARVRNHVEILWGPEIYAYGLHELAIRDNNGYTLQFGQPVAEADGA